MGLRRAPNCWRIPRAFRRSALMMRFTIFRTCRRWEFLVGDAVGGCVGGDGKDVRLSSRGHAGSVTNALVLVFLSLWLGYEALGTIARASTSRRGWMIGLRGGALCQWGWNYAGVVADGNDLNLPAHSDS